MSKVFISYSHKDTAFADMLVDDLREAGIEVWIDQDAIEPGQSIVQRINQGLDSTDYVLILVSSAFLNSNWTRSESGAAVVEAIDSQRDNVIPLLLEDVWAGVPRLIRQTLFVDFRKYANLLAYHSSLKTLVKTLTGVVAPVKSKRRPVVTVTGGREETAEKMFEVAYNLGRQLAKCRLQLRTGVSAGTDLFFTQGVVEELTLASEDPEKFLTQYSAIGKDIQVTQRGRVIESAFRSREEGVPELISDSDVLITVGGKSNTSYFGMVALFEDKILLPIASTRGASQNLFSVVMSRYDKVFGEMLDRREFENLKLLGRTPAQVATTCVRLIELVSGLQLTDSGKTTDTAR
jgi:hypothetical protein